MPNIKKIVLDRANELKEEIIGHRRYLHQNPEISNELPLTTAYVKEKLTEMGYAPIDCSQSGVVAIAEGKKDGKVFMIRGDMDALPLKEEVDIEFKSCNDNMHACGHDLHTAMLLGAAKILKENEDKIQGKVKLMFQPAEETLKGAKAMIEAGLLENPKVDAAMMIHVASGAPIPTGTVVIPKQGIGSSASDWFEIHVQGKGGHGAMPESAVDPINVACHIHTSLQVINSRELGSSDSSVFTVGKIEGGSTSNIIPDTAKMYGTIRTFNKESRKFIPKRMKEISECTAKAFRAEAKLVYIEGCPSVINDKQLVVASQKYLSELLDKKEILDMNEISSALPMSGSEDFGYVSENVPTMSFGLAAGTPEHGYIYPAHHPKVSFDEDALVNGTATYAYMAMRWLEENN